MVGIRFIRITLRDEEMPGDFTHGGENILVKNSSCGYLGANHVFSFRFSVFHLLKIAWMRGERKKESCRMTF